LNGIHGRLSNEKVHRRSNRYMFLHLYAETSLLRRRIMTCLICYAFCRASWKIYNTSLGVKNKMTCFFGLWILFPSRNAEGSVDERECRLEYLHYLWMSMGFSWILMLFFAYISIAIHFLNFYPANIVDIDMACMMRSVHSSGNLVI